jgi:hypothetical protein
VVIDDELPALQTGEKYEFCESVNRDLTPINPVVYGTRTDLNPRSGKRAPKLRPPTESADDGFNVNEWLFHGAISIHAPRYEVHQKVARESEASASR